MQKKMSFFKKFEDIKKPSKFFRALEFSILENLGHCRKNSLNIFYNQLNRNEIEIFKKCRIKERPFFFSFYSEDSNKFRQMLINVFFKVKEKIL